MQTLQLPEIGEVILKKSSRAKRIILKINQRGVPEVTVPSYVPFIMAKRFAIAQQDWIKKHFKPSTSRYIHHTQRIGRTHAIVFQPGAEKKVTSRVSKNQIIVKFPAHLEPTAVQVQDEAYKAAQRAVKREAELVLPAMLYKLAQQYNYRYTSVSVKNMKTRWGSCSSEGVINLNIWLMQLTDELIEYVCLHELAHLNHPHHQPDFWQEVARAVPDYKAKRAKLKSYSPNLVTLSPS